MSNKVVHLYIRRGALLGLNVVQHTFEGGPPVVERLTVIREARAEWLAGQLARPEVKVIYNCHGSGIQKPEPCHVPWFDLQAGHACENI